MTNWKYSKGLTACLIGLTVIVIGLGGLIRIYDAGESCPDWPLCFGTIGFDISEEEQEAWYIENPDEVDSRGSGHRYTTFQIFTEWFHRILAGLVLGPLVILNWYMLRGGEEKVKFASTLTVVLIVWQGAIGWLTVEMDNLHWSVALHLSSALAFTMSMFWLWLTLTRTEDGLPEWLRFDYSISKKWKVRVGLLSLGAFVSIFSGTFVSTTPGANFGCGVDGLPDSWPLCNGKIVDSVEDVVAQSQIIHRWFVGLMLIALIFASYSIYNEQSGNNVLRNWIWGSTFLFFVNTSIGAIYVLSWDLEEGFFEFLSLVHLMMASLTFVTMAISWIGCSIAEDG
ncbi:MAG: COX15/CtaA family protein [Candidatus Thalassarchaeum sp.]|nr:COX15/CtaA family protein [Candidatus Thalassarchaeum sp.]